MSDYVNVNNWTETVILDKILEFSGCRQMSHWNAINSDTFLSKYINDYL